MAVRIRDHLRRLSRVTTVLGAVRGSPREPAVLLIGFAYMVVLGGTGPGELNALLRVVNAALGAMLITVLLLRAPSEADRLDHVVVGTVLLFALAAMLSSFPRQSFDAVLAALTYAAAFFVARGHLTDERVRSWFVATMVALSLFMTLVLAAAWLPGYVELWHLTGVVPSLDIPWNAGPWGHRYDAVLLLALVYPAWWLGRPSALRGAAGTLVGLLGLLLLLIAGSRTIWLAVAVAVAVVVVPWLVRVLRLRPDMRLPAALFSGIGLVALVGVTPFLDRLLSLTSAEWRLAMWRPLIGLWTDAPISGVGPGSFPWTLQLTSYFDTNAHAPRHPDSVLFQVLPEAGLLGMAAVVILAGVGWAVVRSGSWVGHWAVALAVVASIGNNPTDFAFLVVPGIAWAAYALPRRAPVEPTAMRRPSRAYLSVAPVASALIAVTYASTLAGGFMYDEARAAIRRGSIADALGAIQLAAGFDPGMALYAREEGALLLLLDAEEEAAPHLEGTVDLNPSDDVAWRALSLSHAANRSTALAGEAIDRAVAVQRSDPMNLLLAARHAGLAGHLEEATTILAEVVHVWPAIVAAPGWEDQLPDGVTTGAVVDAAAGRWLAGAPIPELSADQGLWLGMMSGDPDVLHVAVGNSPLSTGETAGLLALLGCFVDTSDLLEAPSAGEQRGWVYWMLRARVARERGAEDEVASRVLQLMSGGNPGRPGDPLTNPLNEGAGWSADRWGYRRYSMQLPPGPVMLPSPDAGRARWLSDPGAAAEETALSDRRQACVME